MKNSIFSGLLISSLMLFCGCPVDSAYPLEVNEKGTISENLTGIWITDQTDLEAEKVQISLNEGGKSYKVEVLETGETFMADTKIFKGWLTGLGGRKFLVLQEMQAGKEAEKYYVYDIVIGVDEITTHDISLKVNGTAAITSVQSYQEEVKASMKKDSFLSSEIVWKKAK